MNPTDLKYTGTHEWVRLAGDTATIGITEHAAHALSDLVYLGINSPVDGEVVEVNSALTDNLGDITSDPYGKGWLVKIKLKGRAPASLLDAPSYDKLVAETA